MGWAVGRHVPVVNGRTLCPPHLRHCWPGLLGDAGFSPRVLACSLPAALCPTGWTSSRVPTTSVGQGGVTGLGPRSGGASPTCSGDTVFSVGDPLCSPCRDDLPPACPSCPCPGSWVGVPWGPRHGGGLCSVLGAQRQLAGDLPGCCKQGLNCSALNLLDINFVGLAISALTKRRRGGLRGGALAWRWQWRRSRAWPGRLCSLLPVAWRAVGCGGVAQSLGRPQGIPKDVDAVVHRGHGMEQPWAQERFAVGWVKFGVRLEHFGHGNPLAEHGTSGHQLP